MDPHLPLLADQKKSRIRAACVSRDIAALIDLACSTAGLVDDETRRAAWPLLLGVDAHPNALDRRNSTSVASLPVHRDEGQVSLDVDRSFVYYPKESETKLDLRKHELQDLIVATLRHHPSLCYFQGYHDIVQVLLLVLGRELAEPAAARLSLLRIRDFMLPSMSAAVVHLHLLPPILRVADQRLEKHLSYTRPFFALAATLTLYAHDIQEYSDIARLFDFLLAREAVITIYLFVIIIRSRKDELLEIEPDEPEMLHSVLSKLPKPLDIESLIAQTIDLYIAHPPESLPGGAWRRIPQSSVLKTTRDPLQVCNQTLEDAQKHFDRQARQLQVQQALAQARLIAWRYRKPAVTFATVLVAVLAYSLRRDPVAIGGWSLVKTSLGKLLGI